MGRHRKKNKKEKTNPLLTKEQRLNQANQVKLQISMIDERLSTLTEINRLYVILNLWVSHNIPHHESIPLQVDPPRSLEINLYQHQRPISQVVLKRLN